MLLRRTFAAGFVRKKTQKPVSRTSLPKPGRPGPPSKTLYLQKKLNRPVTKGTARPSSTSAASVAFRTASEGSPAMTISTRITLGVSAAALSLSLALAPAAFAQDKMGKEDGMKKEQMSRDGMKNDSMSKDAMKKDGGMKKDMMKKDDAMKKN